MISIELKTLENAVTMQVWIPAGETRQENAVTMQILFLAAVTMQIWKLK